MSKHDQPTVMSSSSLRTPEGDAGTVAPPPLAPPPVGDAPPAHLAGFPRAGQTLGDFHLLRILGSGAFACVYLAWQGSLGRRVALKVSRNRGQEAQTLARMEHGHVVSVFSEAVDGERNLHLLAMQYVPGASLEDVLAHLGTLPEEARDGKAILAYLDSRPGDTPALDIAALRGRELLATLDHVEAVCWIGARLAEALAHAHALGILHRDVKPANVLINRYGMPLLADFNVAAAEGSGGMGGTLAYMAPEHLEAFRTGRHGAGEGPGPAADLYSLGVLLYQLYTGHLPHPTREGVTLHEAIGHLIEARRRAVPPMSRHVPASPDLERLMARCLAPAPEDRHAGAADLAAALDSAREMHRARAEMPVGGVLSRWAVESPFWFTILLIPLVHVLATFVNIAYNGLRIVSDLTPEQQRLFPWLIAAYNAVAWPVCLTLFLRPVFRVFGAYNAMARAGPVDAGAVEAARREALTLPGLLARYSCLGWLPGGVLFPLALNFAGPVGPMVYGKFAFSFLVAGLIAIVYSVLLMELLVLRVMYPALWPDARGMRQAARAELGREEARLSRLQMLAVLIPLAGAVLLVSVGPDEVRAGAFTREAYAAFRVLVAGLLAAGMFGLGLAVTVSAELRRVVAVLTAEGR